MPRPGDLITIYLLHLCTKIQVRNWKPQIVSIGSLIGDEMCREEEGKIRIRRVGEMFMSLEPLSIYIDGKCVGRILAGDVKDFLLKAGKHRIRIQMESPFLGSFPSNTISVSVDEKTITTVECGSTYKGVKVLVSRFYLFNRNNTFYVREAIS
jgi:hypothetical protein